MHTLSTTPRCFSITAIVDHPPPYAFVSRVTNQSLRSAVLPRMYSPASVISLPPAWLNFWNAQLPSLEPSGLSLGNNTWHKMMYCALHCTDLSILWDCSSVSRSFTLTRDTQMTGLLIRSLSSKSRVQISRVSLCLGSGRSNVVV